MSIHKKSQSTPQNADQNRTKSTIVFTHLTIQHLKPQSKRTIYWCDGMMGFGIRISPRGIKTWIFQFRINGVERRMTLGKFPRMSLSEAIQEYIDNKAKVDNGIDPLEERNTHKSKWKSEPTVGELIDIYISYCKKTGKRTYKDEERALGKNMPKDVMAMKIGDVPAKRLSHAVDTIIERGALSMAEHFYRYTRRMFNFAMDRDLMDSNPCAKIKVRIRKRKRQRHLDLKEIYLFWNNLEDVPMCTVKRLMLKFLLCTVTRPIDVRHMRWSHVNLNQKIWTLPTTKNGILHRVYLGDVAINVLKEVARMTGDYELVFGSFGSKAFNGGKLHKPKALTPLSKGSLSQSLRLHFDKLQIEQPFYPYDLRRTGATMIAGLFGRRDFATMALNHTTNDVTGIYDQYTYDREKKMMLNALNKAIDIIINSPNVESVPDFEELRHHVIQSNASSNSIDGGSGDNAQGLQASFSSPVSYTLSYDHDGSRHIV